MTLPPSLAQLNGRLRPNPSIVQFSGGNFLRGFMDWKINRLNESMGSDWDVAILRSVELTEGSAPNAQGVLFTIVSRGIGEDGAAQSHSHLVASVLQELSCDGDWPLVLAYARNPLIEVVLSATTEVGIAYVARQAATDTPPASFLAKLAHLLVKRWRALGHLAGMGWQILRCALPENSADRLRDLVLRHAQDWAVGAECLDWIARGTVFYTSLADRIATGHPSAKAAAVLATALGHRDPCRPRRNFSICWSSNPAVQTRLQAALGGA